MSNVELKDFWEGTNTKMRHCVLRDLDETFTSIISFQVSIIFATLCINLNPSLVN
jgi:hypothetical protein